MEQMPYEFMDYESLLNEETLQEGPSEYSLDLIRYSTRSNLLLTIRKWAPKAAFLKLYISTIEPSLLFAIEAWCSSQHILQNSIERVKKFAVKLCGNDFTASYTHLLERLSWKSIIQIAMEKRALAMHHFIRGYQNLPEAIVLCSEDRRRASRISYEWELVIPVSSLEAVRSSSLNIARLIWNHLLEDIATIPDPTRFKNAVKQLLEILHRI
uniref:Uncharacterized protein n=1 Tax=Acrobeloides nanus TaxID=290746 RepID=A0A914EPN5_9BILA